MNDVNKLPVCSLQGLLLIFLDKRDDLGKKNEEFYNSAMKKVFAINNGMSFQLFAVDLQVRDIYPELKI